MSYSRRFPFFDKVPLNVESKVEGFQDLPVSCCRAGDGFLWLGGADGFMYCLDSTFYLSAFRVHDRGPIRHCRVLKDFLITVAGTGDDEEISVWNTKNWCLASKTSLPTCSRTLKTAPPPTKACVRTSTSVEVTCMDVSPELDLVVLGHSNGTVQLLKGDLSSDRHTRRIILHEFPTAVTGIHFVTSAPTRRLTAKASYTGSTSVKHLDSVGHLPSASPKFSVVTPPPMDNDYVYASTETQLISVLLGKRLEPVRTTNLDTFGCGLECTRLLTENLQQPGLPNLLMTHKDAVYFYDVDGRGPCLAIDGQKRALRVYKNYIVTIKQNRMQGVSDEIDAFPNHLTRVSVFEWKNKFVAGEFVIPWAHSIITGWDGLFVLAKETDPATGTSLIKIFELVEKDTQSKLEVLFAKKSFNLAVGIAESHKFSEEELAHIHRRYADHLFKEKQYDLAVKEYINTIGTVEASYVVLRLLESGLINHLTRYLEALHTPEHMKAGRLTKDHTALLLNSYARLGDKERIDAFLKILSERSNVGPEFFACITVLRRAGYPQQALALARLTHNSRECLQILVDDMADAGAVIAEINSLQFDHALEAICTHGSFLMKNLPTETAELLDKICSDPESNRISVDHFLKIFVNNRTGLMKFLERYIQKPRSGEPSVPNLVETVLELCLYEADAIRSANTTGDDDDVDGLHQLAMRLLSEINIPYDEGKALIICNQRNFYQGCLYIWTKNKQYDQILEHHVLKGDIDAILETCNKYGNEMTTLWFEAFKYVARKPELGDKLPGILTRIEEYNLASPLLVLQFLTSQESDNCHKLGSIKSYLLRYLESGKERFEANQAEMQKLREETLKNREICRQSKTKVKIFQQQKCVVCHQALEPPSVHFLCDHSYHKACFDTYSFEDQQCPECAPLHRQRMIEAEQAATTTIPRVGVDILDQLTRALGVGGVSSALGQLIGGGVLGTTPVTPTPWNKPSSQFNGQAVNSRDQVTRRPPKLASLRSATFDYGVGSQSPARGSPQPHRVPVTAPLTACPPQRKSIDSGVGTAASRSRSVFFPAGQMNPFDEQEEEDEAEVGRPERKKMAARRAVSMAHSVPKNPFDDEEAYPDYLNPF